MPQFTVWTNDLINTLSRHQGVRLHWYGTDRCALIMDQQVIFIAKIGAPIRRADRELLASHNIVVC